MGNSSINTFSLHLSIIIGGEGGGGHPGPSPSYGTVIYQCLVQSKTETTSMMQRLYFTLYYVHIFNSKIRLSRRTLKVATNGVGRYVSWL